MANEKMELDLDTLSSVTGGVGSKPGVEVLDGKVTAILPNCMLSVDVDGKTVTAHLSGKLRPLFARIRVGDRVRVEGNRVTSVYT